jgi:hypothetical protein
MPMGEVALDALAEQVEEFEFCPDHDEIMAWGTALIKSYAELEVLLEKRKRAGACLQDRARARAKARGTSRFGFVRGN